MAPAEGRRRMNAAERRGLRQALAFDHRSGVIEPTILLAQMRHRRLGQRVEGAPATLAAKPQKPVRAAPADDCSARAMGTALGLHTLMAGRSKRVLAATTLAAPLRPSPVRSSDAAPVFARSAFDSASKASRLWSTLCAAPAGLTCLLISPPIPNLCAS